MDAVELLLNALTDERPTTRAELRRLKTAMASQTGTPLIRNDALLNRYRHEVATGQRAPDEQLQRLLTLNGVRSQSGIATVTVITEPYPCPGRCVYCPTEIRAPKSYLTNEPAVMRALRNEYDPARQVQERLRTLQDTGHPTDKVELIIKGGTWSFYPEAYQREFIRRCIEASNNFSDGGGKKEEEGGASDASSLDEAQRINETAASRIIGVTIETRPDSINEAEILRLRRLGVTRVELGVQTLDDTVLRLIVRGHGTAEVRRATRWLKDAGFKVAYHLMPNLPGATPASDLDSAQRLFEDPGFRPDTLKLYPCVVIDSAELAEWWRQGRYQPYDDDMLIELLIGVKQCVPPYVRIERIVRDIPSTSIRAGCLVTNLREEIQRRMRQRGLRCCCIRCRQVREETTDRYVLVRRTYEASDGLEVFLSFEDAATDRLASLLRLRIPSPSGRTNGHQVSILAGAGLIRELHSYGRHLPLHHRSRDAAQHRGLGQRLLREAERITREEFGLRRMAVIAGVGVREYYRKLGYELRDTYMVKDLR